MKTKVHMRPKMIAILAVMLCSAFFNIKAQTTCQAGFTSAVNANTATFTNTSTGGTSNTNYYWDFGDGNSSTTSSLQSQTHQYVYNGLYQVCVFMSDSNSTAGCWSSYCDSIVITGANTPCNLSLSASGTNPSSATANDGSVTVTVAGGTAPYAYLWTPGNQQSAAVQGLGNGCYVVHVTDATGCADTSTVCISDSSSGNPCNVVAGFTSNNSNDPTISFTNTSTGVSAPVYYWSFGDGTNLWGTNATHTYQNNGSYVVCLSTYDSLNFCGDSYCDTIVISNAASQPCLAQFYSYPDSNNTTSGTMQFYDYSTGGATSWSWTFGDGSTSTQQHPSHHYAQAGTYQACLTITTAAGTCSSCDTVVVGNSNPGPCVAQFYSYPDSNNTTLGTVHFYDYSTAGTSILSWSWNFGDGSTSSVMNPTHHYAQPGNYQVCLTITTASGTCSSCSTVTVNTNPVSCSASMYLAQDTTSANSLTWYAYTYITGVAPFTYSWNFGDGSTSTQQYPSHTYAQAGNYLICLTITDAIGCSSATCDSTNKLALSGNMQYLVVMNTTGIEENTVSVNSIFPNPASDVIDISLSQLVKGSLMITDMIGREVYSENINSDNVKLNVSNLPIGYYNLSIVSGTKMGHSKIMIVR